MKKSIILSLHTFIFFYCLTPNTLNTMNQSYNQEDHEIILTDAPEKWTSCCYGKWFDKNNHTLDCKTPYNKTCCRTHKTTLALTAACCIVSNLALPYNPTPWIYISQSICFADQLSGLCNQSSRTENQFLISQESKDQVKIAINLKFPSITFYERL